MTEDLAVFFNTAEFADIASIGVSEFNVIYRNGSSPAFAGFVGFDATQPTILCKTTDLADAEEGTVIIVKDIPYKIGEMLPDESGELTVVELKK